MVNNISSAQSATAALFLTILIGAMPGCAGRPGFPKQSFDEKALIADLEKKFRLPDKIKEYYDVKIQLQKSNDPRTFVVLTDGQRELLKTKRNEIISARLALIDLNYNQFVSDASFNRQVFNLTTEIADLGVDIATTAVSGASTKTTLGAISAGISGTQTAVAKNLFFEKTVTALVSAMNACRKQALIPIIDGALKPIDDYPLERALSDLNVYYFSGTFLGALNTIQTTSAAQEEQARGKIIEIQVNNDREARRLRKSIYIWLKIPGNREKLKAEVARQYNNADYLDWLQTASANDLKKVMGVLDIPERTEAQLEEYSQKRIQDLDDIMGEEEKKLEAAKDYIAKKTLAAVRNEIQKGYESLSEAGKEEVLGALAAAKIDVTSITDVDIIDVDITDVDTMTEAQLADAMVRIFNVKKEDVTDELKIKFTFIAAIQKGVP